MTLKTEIPISIEHKVHRVYHQHHHHHHYHLHHILDHHQLHINNRSGFRPASSQPQAARELVAPPQAHASLHSHQHDNHNFSQQQLQHDHHDGHHQHHHNQSAPIVHSRVLDPQDQQAIHSLTTTTTTATTATFGTCAGVVSAKSGLHHQHTSGIVTSGRSKQRSQVQFLLISAITYVLSPIDLIPEAIFGIFGILDDIVFLLMCLFCVAIILLYPLFREVRRTVFDKLGLEQKHQLQHQQQQQPAIVLDEYKCVENKLK